MFRGVFLFFLGLFSIYVVSAQEPMGVVLDSITRQKVPYAYLLLPDQSRGISSNENGAYPLIDISKGRLIVSCLGYKSKIIDLSTYLTFPQEILLQPSSTTLTEVEVVGLSAKGLLAKVIEYIPNNYPATEFLASYYYRAQAVDNKTNTPLYAEECIFQQIKKYQKGYRASLRLLKNRIYNLSDKSVRISGVGLQDYVLSLLSMPVKSNISYGRKISNEAQTIIELKLKSDKDKPIGSLYIDSASYAIVKFDIADKKLHHIAEYKPINGKYYLNRLQTVNKQNSKLTLKSDVILNTVQSSFSHNDLQGISVESWEGMFSYVNNFKNEVSDSIIWSNHNSLLPDKVLSDKIAQNKPIRASLKQSSSVLPLPSIALSIATYGLNKKAIAETSIGLGSLGSHLVYTAIRAPFACLLGGMLLSEYLQSPIEGVLLEQEHFRQLGISATAYYLPFNRYQESYLRVNKRAVEQLRKYNYMEFLHMYTIRNEYHYMKSRVLEEMMMNIDLKYGDNYRRYFNYLLGQLIVSKFYNIHFKKRDEINENIREFEEVPVNINRDNSWVKYLFEPKAEFTPQVLLEDLTSEQRKFLKVSSLKSWINLLSPALFSLGQFSVGNNWRVATSLGYLRTPIGEQLEESVWLSYKKNLHNINIKQFLGYSTLGWGVGYKLHNFQLSKNFRLTSHVEAWFQPKSFLEKSLLFGGRIGQDLTCQIKLNTRNPLNIHIGYEWKSKGFSYENNRLKSSLDFKLGIAYDL